LEAHPDREEGDEGKYHGPPEEAVENAIHAEIRAVVEHDRWPRHVHRKDV